MDKRNAKLRQNLQLLKMRLQKATLQQVELKEGEKTEVLTVDPEQPDFLDSGSTRVAATDLAPWLERRLAGCQRATVVLKERGTLVTLEVLPGDVKLSFSTLDQPVHQRPTEFGTRQQFIRVEEAGPLLQALDIVSAEGKVRADKRRKYYQVDRFVELVDEVLEEWRLDRPLTILDCGCGKSYLSFVLNYWLTEKRRIPCRVIGIDGNAQVVEASRRIQNQLGYRNMEFVTTTILAFKFHHPVDMVLSLHACDTATDEALALGMHLGSKYIISVPCCQAALRDRLDYRPWQAVTRHNIFRNRLADVLTDGLRAAALEARGYKVSVVEYLSPLDTPKNIMLRAVARGQNPRAQLHYQELCQGVKGTPPLDEFLQVLASR